MFALVGPAVSIFQEIDGQDKIVELINNVIVALVQVNTAQRPSAAATNRKLAKFIRELIESSEDNDA